MTYETIDVRPLSPSVGAEVLGVDLAADLGNAQFSEIRRAFHDHGVVVFRDQKLSPEQHLAFSRRFGPINVNRFFRQVEGYPEVAEVLKEPDQKKNIGANWHTDHSYDGIPALGSVLRAIEVPPVGGDTLFASMSNAFDALSEGLKQSLRGLNAVHGSEHVFGPSRYEREGDDVDGRLGNPDLATQEAVHPVVIRHPDTGRETLYVNPTFTLRFEGWSAEESAPLLGYLYEHAARPEFTCRVRWHEGSVTLWDNRATWHLALNDYHGHRRYMHRVTIEGVPLHA
jgi:taurine dioxygenase